MLLRRLYRYWLLAATTKSLLEYYSGYGAQALILAITHSHWRVKHGPPGIPSGAKAHFPVRPSGGTTEVVPCYKAGLSRVFSERFGHFFEDGVGGFGGVGGLGDGAAYDQVAGALAEGFGGGGDALLVACLSAGGADAGGDQHAIGAGEGAQGRHLLGRADEAAQPGGEAHPRQQFDLFAGGALDADGADLGRVHAGEHGDGEEFRRVGDAGERGPGGGQHGGTTCGVDGDHAHAQRGGGAHGGGHGVGNVVELEVEEDGVAAPDERLENGGTGGDKKLQPHLEPLAVALELGDEAGGGGPGGDGEGDA